jgi:hypothetical protein
LRHYEALHDFAVPATSFLAAVAATGLAVTFGLIQAGIAKEQARIAEVRLRHDLFERRIAVFNSIRDVLMEVARSSKVSDECWNKFVRGVETTEFLFDQEIARYVADLRNRVSQFKHVVELLAANAQVGEPEGKTFAQIRSDHSIWLVGQLDFLVAKFKTALALEQHTVD